MKKNDIVLAVAIITLTMMACTQRKQQIAISRPSQQESEVDRVKKHSEKISEDQNQSSEKNIKGKKETKDQEEDDFF